MRILQDSTELCRIFTFLENTFYFVLKHRINFTGNMELLHNRSNERVLYAHQLSDNARDERNRLGNLSVLYAEGLRSARHGSFC